MSAPRTEEHVPAQRSGGPKLEHRWLVAHPKPAVLPWKWSDFGRDDFAALGIVDPKISSRHFVVTGHGGVPQIADLGSRNGTYVNAQKLGPGERVRLHEGAVVRVGATLLVYRKIDMPLEPMPPLGALVGPFGLTKVRAAIDHFVHRRGDNLLVLGESGSGKELVARHVAERLGLHMIAVNMAAIPPQLAESQLFGYVPGAFSDARKQGSRGLVGDAEGGVLFLDELGEFPLELQPKLLRLLENRTAQEVGGKERRVSVTIIAATNRDIDEAVDRGVFRRDLAERFAHRVELPSLAERPEDLPSIVDGLIAFANLPLRTAPPEPEALEHLMRASFPGNLRTLRRVLETCASQSGHLSLRALPLEQLEVRQESMLTAEAIERALAEARGNASLAARHLGVSRGAFLRARQKMK